jgi:hypothetical protein
MWAGPVLAAAAAALAQVGSLFVVAVALLAVAGLLVRRIARTLPAAQEAQ